MSESYIETGSASTTFVGPDATALFAATVLRNAIMLYLATGIKANRVYTPANMLTAASRITGKPYKRGRNGLTLAARDIAAWCDAMRAKLPVVEGSKVSLANMNPAAMAAAARNARKEV